MELSNYIYFAAAIHGFIFAMVLFTSRKGYYTTNIILGILILSLSIELFTSIDKIFPQNIISIKTNPIIFLYGPLLYLYILLATRKNKKEFHSFIYAVLPVYCIPLVLYTYQYMAFSFHNSTGINILSDPKEHILGTDIFSFSPVVIALFIVNTGIYLVLSLKEVKNFSEEIKSVYSNIQKVTYIWINIMLYIWIGLILLFILFSLLRIFNIFRITDAYTIIRFTIAIVIFLIGYFNLRHPLFFDYSLEDQNPPNNHTQSNQDSLNQKKNSGDILEQSDNSQKKQKIVYHMENEKPYLNSDLTINELSQQLGMHYKTLSRIINNEFHCSFYDFINKYRINEVKQKLGDFQMSTSPIINIAYECGFNSKSSFNTLFKKFTGCTPSDYRKKCIEKS